MSTEPPLSEDELAAVADALKSNHDLYTRRDIVAAAAATGSLGVLAKLGIDGADASHGGGVGQVGTQSDPLDHVWSASVDTEQLYTGSRGAAAVVENRGGTYVADGPNGEIASGTDLGAVLNSVFNSLASGEKVFIRAAETPYTVNTTIETPVEAFTLEGEGLRYWDGDSNHGVQLKAGTSLTGPVIKIGDQSSSTKAFRFTLRNLSVSAGGNVATGVEIYGSENRLENVEVTDANTQGVDIPKASGQGNSNILRGCRITDNNGKGVVDGSNDTYIGGWTVIARNGGIGIQSIAGGPVYEALNMFNNSSYEISIEDAGDFRISNIRLDINEASSHNIRLQADAQNIKGTITGGEFFRRADIAAHVELDDIGSVIECGISGIDFGGGDDAFTRTTGTGSLDVAVVASHIDNQSTTISGLSIPSASNVGAGV